MQLPKCKSLECVMQRIICFATFEPAFLDKRCRSPHRICNCQKVIQNWSRPKIGAKMNNSSREKLISRGPARSNTLLRCGRAYIKVGVVNKEVAVIPGRNCFFAPSKRGAIFKGTRELRPTKRSSRRRDNSAN